MAHHFWDNVSIVFILLFLYDAQVSADSSLNFTNSNWIWSPESIAPLAPAEDRAFRKNVTAPQGKTLQSADILITVDDSFDLYVDGKLIGSSPHSTNSWQAAERYLVGLSGSSTLIAVHAINLPDSTTSDGSNAAGLLAAIQVTYTDGSSAIVRTDASWKANKTVDSDFDLASMDDSTWLVANSLGAFGISPWGTDISVPDPSSTTTSEVSTSTASTPASPTPTQSTSNSSSPKSHTPVIVGAVVGAVGFCIVVIILLRFIIARRRRPKDRRTGPKEIAIDDEPRVPHFPHTPSFSVPSFRRPTSLSYNALDTTSDKERRTLPTAFEMEESRRASTIQDGPVAHTPNTAHPSPAEATVGTASSAGFQLSPPPVGSQSQKLRQLKRPPGSAQSTAAPGVSPSPAQDSETISDLQERLRAIESVVISRIAQSDAQMQSPSTGEQSPIAPPPYVQ